MEKYLTSVECVIVRETMLRQEKIYKEQVQALHDLYEIQRSMMEELASRNPPQQHQFFPLKQESKPTPTLRDFDLEKLPDPDENLDVQREVNCDLELVLTCGSRDVDLAVKRPRLINTDVPIVQEEVQPNLFHQQWLMDGIGNHRQHYSNANGFFQFEVPYDFGQIPVNGLASSGRLVNGGFPRPTLEQDIRTGLWFGHQQAAAIMQQNLHITPHPWQLSGGAYFNGLVASNMPVSLDGIPNGSSGSSLFSFAAKRYTDGFHQADRQPRNNPIKNGFDHGANLSYSVTNPTTRQDLNGIVGIGNLYKDGYRNSSVTAIDEQNYHRQSNPYAETTTEIKSEHKDAEERAKDAAAADDDDDVAKLAASILVSLTLDQTRCDRKESSPTLKDSVAWFADAIPAAGIDADEKKPSSPSPELDHFENATLHLKAIDESEHAPITRSEPETVPSFDRSNSRARSCSGRPTRSNKKQRDFRNNTLPSITSLSRQEITEDWQIMSGLLRSNDPCGGSGGGGAGQTDRRNGKFCSISRIDGAAGNSRITSPVSTLDQYSSPSKTSRRSSSVSASATPVAAAATAAANGSTTLPWLVTWGESTRRKRKQRRRSSASVSQKLKLVAAAAAAATNTKSRRVDHG